MPQYTIMALNIYLLEKNPCTGAFGLELGSGVEGEEEVEREKPRRENFFLLNAPLTPPTLLYIFSFLPDTPCLLSHIVPSCLLEPNQVG